jgi:glycine/serine hydroxymethyltransferase
MGPEEMVKIAEFMDRVLHLDEDKEDEAKMAVFNAEIEKIRGEVRELTSRFPLY